MPQRATKLSHSHLSLAGSAKLIGIVCLLFGVVSAAAESGLRPAQNSNPAFAWQTASSETKQTRPAEIRELKQGQVIEQSLAGGEAHTYRIALASGQYLKVVVEQKGIDVVVRLFGPDGKKMTEVDSPNGTQGPEPVPVIAEVTGEYQLEVKAGDEKAVPGRYEIKVEELRESTVRDRDRITAERVFNEAVQLRAQGTAGSLRKAIEKYHEALPLWRAVGDRQSEALTLSGIGVMHSRLSEYQKALEYYNQVLSLWRALGNRKEEAIFLHNSGVTHWQLGDSQKALEYYGQALPLRREVGDRQGEAITLSGIGQVYDRLGKLPEAIDYFNQALTLQRAIDDRRGEIVTLNNLGVTYNGLGELQKALEYYAQALAMQRTLGDRRSEANTLSNIGVAYRQSGDLQKALDYYHQALPLRRLVGDRSGEASTLINIGAVYGWMNEPQKALEYYDQAIPLARAIGDRREEANALIQLGRVYPELGEPQKAVTSLNQALLLLRALGDRLREAVTLAQLGTIYSSLGKPEEALSYLQQALSWHRAVGDQFNEALTLRSIAQAERDRGHLTEARAQIELALNIIESVRSKFINQQLRTSFLASRQSFYEFYIALLMRLHRDQPSSGYEALALQTSERERARSLLEMLNESRVNIRQGIEASLLEQERALQQQLTVKAERLTRLLSGKPTEEQATAARKEVAALLEEYQEVQAKIRAKSPLYAALTQPQPLSLKAIQQQVLDPDTLLLEYALGEERSYLWAVTPTSITSFELPKRIEIENQARQVYDLLTARNRFVKFEAPDERQARIAKAEAEYYRAAGSLSQVLLGPVAAKLPGKRLLIVGDGALQYLPFAALPMPAMNKAKNKGQSPANSYRPLIVDREVISLPSASVLGVLRSELAGRQPAPKTVAVLADPVFSEDDERVTPAKATQKSRRAQSGDEVLESELVRSVRDLGRADVWEINRLPFTRREAEVILSLTAEAEHFKALDFDANRAAATNPELSHYRIIHFGTHGLLNSTHPALSGLILSLVDQQGQEQDGFLSAQEIFNLKLPAELVVLSGCQTGLGKDVKGEGLLSLTRGFMYAGAARVVVSLWEVNDQSTAELMKRFYQGMLGAERLSPAAALRAAQISLWKTGRWHSPYYWAAFTLQGEPK